MQKIRKKQTIQISKALNAKLERSCAALGVSKKNLVLFLVSNSYDNLLEKSEDDRKRLIESVLRDYKKQAEKADKNKEDYQKRKRKDVAEEQPDMKEKCERPENFTYLCVEMGKFVYNYIEELSNSYQYSKQDILVALIRMSIHIIDILLFDYKDTEQQTEDWQYAFQKDKMYFLDCVGISQKDFARLSEAVVLQELFQNSSIKIRNMPSYGYYEYISNVLEMKEKTEEEKKEKNKKRKQRVEEILAIIEEREKAGEMKTTTPEKRWLAEQVIKTMEKKEQKKESRGTSAIFDSRFYVTKRRYKSRKKEDKND